MSITFKIVMGGIGTVTPREIPAPPVAALPETPARGVSDPTPKIEDE